MLPAGWLQVQAPAPPVASGTGRVASGPQATSSHLAVYLKDACVQPGGWDAQVGAARAPGASGLIGCATFSAPEAHPGFCPGTSTEAELIYALHVAPGARQETHTL